MCGGADGGGDLTDPDVLEKALTSYLETTVDFYVYNTETDQVRALSSLDKG
jgi:hypothetical protein